MRDDAGIGSTLVRNDVIASPSSTMRELLDYLHDKYGDIEGYLKVGCEWKRNAPLSLTLRCAYKLRG